VSQHRDRSTPPKVNAPSPTRRVGRPPRIDRDAIAQAVLNLGLDGISVKAVAEHLGVSAQGLYHHVRNRKELLLLAAEYSVSRMPAPEDRGQHWDEWLREWARHVYVSFVDEPEVVAHFLSGDLRWEAMVDVIDSVLQVLGRAGFDPPAALAAFDTVALYAVGAAAHEIRRQRAAREGRSTLAELHRVTSSRPADELPGVRALLKTPPLHLEQDFEEQLTTVLVGIAARRREDWQPIVQRGAPTLSHEGPTGSQPGRASMSA
jgi:AcrR family transcriptional regulator